MVLYLLNSLREKEYQSNTLLPWFSHQNSWYIHRSFMMIAFMLKIAATHLHMMGPGFPPRKSSRYVGLMSILDLLPTCVASIIKKKNTFSLGTSPTFLAFHHFDPIKFLKFTSHPATFIPIRISELVSKWVKVGY